MKKLKRQFLFDLAEVFEADHRISKALPRMIKADTPEGLKLAILTQAKDTAGHVRKVGKLFECFGQSATGQPPSPPAGCGAEAGDFAKPCGSAPANDSALISALEVVDHAALPHSGSRRDWQIASYGCLLEWANLPGNREGADFLEEILAEQEPAGPADLGHSDIFGKKAS